MPAPSARFPERSVRGAAGLIIMVVMILGTSCNLVLRYGTEPSASSAPSHTADASRPAAPSPVGGTSQKTAPSVGPCEAAPGWLVSALEDGLAVRGATLSEIYIGEAWGFTSGPATVMSAEFVPAWWIVAKINGAGVRPEAAVWVSNRTGAGTAGTIFGANPSAIRYTKFGQGGSNPIRGAGQEQVLVCLTPIPES